MSLIRTCFRTVLVLSAISTASQSMAQEKRNAALRDQKILGSPPFLEAVDRFRSGREPKIVGGKPAATGMFPWQASLGVSWIADPYAAHFCGGAIYSPTWIVTAAHCLVNNAPSDVVVTTGTNTLGVGGMRVNAKRIIVKANYDAKRQDNDIALIELIAPLKIGAEISSIPLLDASQEKTLLKKGTGLSVTGWGARSEGESKVRDLRYADVPFVERESCNRPLAYDGAITSNMICAGVEVGGVDSCQGDSGGPLTISTAGSKILVGVVSWGEGCARPNRVGVYSRVANYVTWIKGCVATPEAC